MVRAGIESFVFGVRGSGALGVAGHSMPTTVMPVWRKPVGKPKHPEKSMPFRNPEPGTPNTKDQVRPHPRKRLLASDRNPVMFS